MGWIGTGALGSAIVQRMMECGVEMAIYNRTTAKLKHLVEQGAEYADSPKKVAASCEYVFLCLKGHEALENVIFDSERGIVAANHDGLTIVDTSTIHPSFAERVYRRLNDWGISYAEAPVSGGPEGALQGTLSTILACHPAVADKVQTLIANYSDPIHYVGTAGRAQTLKLMNNLAESINLIGAAEVIAIGLAAGFSLDMLNTVLFTTRGHSVYMSVLLERLLQPREEVSASLAIRVKDLQLAADLAREHETPIPMGALAEQLFKLAACHLGSESDQSSVFKIFEKSK